MRSIKLKLTLGALALLAGSVGLLLVASVFLLEPFYAAETKGVFTGFRSSMDAAPEDLPTLERESKALTAGTEYKIVVVDREGMGLVSSVPEFQPGARFPLPREEMEFFQKRRENLDRGETFFGIVAANPPGQSVIQLVGAMRGRNYIVISQPLDHLRRSMSAASHFFLVAGSLVLLLVFVIVLFLAGNFVRPILDLSGIARRIAAGDLSARYGRKRGDEIGQLGESLDAMAAELARNIEDLKAANRGLADKLEAQERFVAGASHELKTPVGLVRGYAEALKLGLFASGQEREELIDIILKESDHLDHLVSDLASIAAAKAESPSDALVDSDLTLTLSAAIARFTFSARERNIALDLHVPQGTTARFDPRRILQVLDNLLANALRHTLEGGRIELRASARRGMIEIEVENSGVPIPERHLVHLFEAFYRVDDSRSRQ
ncbi:MAG: HAMP domain-containing sensor histidine kinase, partial [Spirochaetota bacterium]